MDDGSISVLKCAACEPIRVTDNRPTAMYVSFSNCAWLGGIIIRGIKSPSRMKGTLVIIQQLSAVMLVHFYPSVLHPVATVGNIVSTPTGAPPNLALRHLCIQAPLHRYCDMDDVRTNPDGEVQLFPLSVRT